MDPLHTLLGIKSTHLVAGIAIEGEHAANGCGHVVLAGHAALERGGDHAGAQGLGKH